MNFLTLNIKKQILDGVAHAQYSEMTQIQEQIIPLALQNKDVIGQAPTGTGKTCAFVVPTLEQLNVSERNIQTLVLCPTRELAMQITTEYKKIAQFIPGVKSLAIYGGQKIGQQLKMLKDHPQIIVSTPGRLLDHLQQKTINLTQVKTIILDEADEMLDMGFIRDIDKILQRTNSSHQTILLSATMPKAIMDISHKYQKNPTFVKATLDEKDIPSIAQHYIKTPEFKKVEVIMKLIKDKNFYLVLIFTNTRHKAKSLVRQLRDQNIKADAIHSDLKQSARDRVMRSFREGKIQVLVATDIAARGIDVKGVDAVINYDVPKNMEYYVHRIGRTARAKMTGSAYTLMSNDVKGSIRTIERHTNDKLAEHVVEGIDFNQAPPPRERREFSNDRRERNDRFNRSERPQHTFERKESDGTTTRFFATIGFKDNMDNNSLKEYLTANIGIPQTDIIDVWVKDTYSFIEIKNEQIDKLKSITEVNGRHVKIAPAAPRNKERDAFKRNRDDRSRSGGFRRFGDRKPGGFGGHRSFGSGHSFGDRNNKPSFDNRDPRSSGHGRSFDRNKRSGSFHRNDRPYKSRSFSK